MTVSPLILYHTYDSLEWDDHAADFAPSPLTGCCPPVPVCLSDGTCHYEGHK